MIKPLLSLSILALLGNASFSQCTPDAASVAGITFGIAPQELPLITPNVAYDGVMTIKVPASATAGELGVTEVNGITVPANTPINITSVEVTNIQNLPNGLSYDCNPTDCTFLGGTLGCISINGTITSVGTGFYDLTFDLIGNGSVSIFGQNLPVNDVAFSRSGYGLRTGYVGVEEEMAAIEAGNNFPNPFSNFTTIPYELKSAGNVELKVMDITGKIVFSNNYQGNAGINKINFSSENLKSGIYFYTLNTGGKLSTKRMVIKKN